MQWTYQSLTYSTAFFTGILAFSFFLESAYASSIWLQVKVTQWNLYSNPPSKPMSQLVESSSGFNADLDEAYDSKSVSDHNAAELVPSVHSTKPKSRFQILSEEYYTTKTKSVKTQSMLWPKPPPIPTLRCRCRRNHCSQLYCECLKAGKRCNPYCSCADCTNKAENVETNHPASSTYGKHAENCKCRRSKCIKKYCTCFTRKSFCNKKCKCHCCDNRPAEPIKEGLKITIGILEERERKSMPQFKAKQIVLKELNSLSVSFTSKCNSDGKNDQNNKMYKWVY